MRPNQSSSSREKLLFHLKTKGPQTAAQLAERLRVTPMAVRQHLAKLEERELVVSEDEAGRVGRPRKVWQLAAAAEERFPDNHAELALGLLDAARTTLGAKGVEKLIASRVSAQVAEYEARMPEPDAELKLRVSALANLRRGEGYMAEWKREGQGFALVENHCPICVAAESCVGLCDGELALFSQVLGSDVTVERTEYLLDGDRRCVYSIQPR